MSGFHEGGRQQPQDSVSSCTGLLKAFDQLDADAKASETFSSRLGLASVDSHKVDDDCRQ